MPVAMLLSGSVAPGSSAPADPAFILSEADPDLPNARVLTDSDSVTWDFSVPGAAKAKAAASRPFGASFDGNGFPLTTTGTTKVAFGPLESAGTVSKVSIITVGGSGSAVIGVKRCAFGSYPGSLTDVTGGHDVTLSSASTMQDTTLSGWTLSFSLGDVYEFELKSVSGAAKQVQVRLHP